MCGSYKFIELLLGSGVVIELWCYKDTFLSMKNVSLFNQCVDSLNFKEVYFVNNSLSVKYINT